MGRAAQQVASSCTALEKTTTLVSQATSSIAEVAKGHIFIACTGIHWLHLLTSLMHELICFAGLGGGAARVPMAMRAVPINAAIPTVGEPSAAAAAPDTSIMGPQKSRSAQQDVQVNAPGNTAPQEGSRGASWGEAAGSDSVQTDNNKKRKADGEARQSPEVATAVAGAVGKRRASPEAEVCQLCRLTTVLLSMPANSHSHKSGPLLVLLLCNLSFSMYCKPHMAFLPALRCFFRHVSSCSSSVLSCIRPGQQDTQIPLAASQPPPDRQLSRPVLGFPTPGQQLLSQLHRHHNVQLPQMEVMTRSLRRCHCWLGGSWRAGRALHFITRYCNPLQGIAPSPIIKNL